MTARQVKPNIYSVGAIDWDRRLFDSLIPLPHGTSYNAYLIKGSEKTALLDTVDPTKAQDLFDNLAELKVEKIDYVVIHHVEQDHSGCLPQVLQRFPLAKVVTNARAKEMIKDHLLVADEKIIVVNDRETLSLGDRTLEFILAPWVHWPETMFTYLKEDKVLFTCDFLGSHLATSDLFAGSWDEIVEGAKRYYAEIMMPFRTSIKQHLEALKGYQFDLVAPSHGPIYNDPKPVLAAYTEWASDLVKNEVVIAYVSMHGSTAEMVRHLTDALVKRGLIVKQFDLPRTDVGELAMALVDAATVVIGTPTVLAGAHPAAVYAAFLANALRPKMRFVSVLGSFGWGGKAVEQLAGLLTNLKVEIIPPVIVKGYPKEADLKAIEALAGGIYAKHQTLGIAK
ncbi:MAG: FprA family A-type flavoprotein [Candidatus Margulisiibacteriota bacterium]